MPDHYYRQDFGVQGAPAYAFCSNLSSNGIEKKTFASSRMSFKAYLRTQREQLLKLARTASVLTSIYCTSISSITNPLAESVDATQYSMDVTRAFVTIPAR